MKKLIILLLVAFTTQAAVANTAGGQDTIPIELSKTITVNWSIKNAKVVQDDVFMKLKSNKKALKSELLDLIADGTELDLEACFKKGKVKRGDVAFYLFDVVFNIPYDAAIGKTFPDFLLSCTPPVGLYDYLDANRGAVAQSMIAFYTKAK